MLAASDPCSTATQEPFRLHVRVDFHSCEDLERGRFFIEGTEMRPSLDLEVAYFVGYNAAQIIWDLVYCSREKLEEEICLSGH